MIERKEKILNLAKNKSAIKTLEIAALLGVSRQFALSLLRELVDSGQLVKAGSTRGAIYFLPENITETVNGQSLPPGTVILRLSNNNLEEHKILEEIERRLPQLKGIKENILSIFQYAFSEMTNNAIEHSLSKKINLVVSINSNRLEFFITDDGVGVFESIRSKKYLSDEMEALGELLKGKMTTQPRSHSGEGIFFTSRVADVFILSSHKLQLLADNKIKDVFILDLKKPQKGTKVSFEIALDSHRHLNDVFKKYTNLDDGSHGFDQTEIKVKLYAMGGIYISRSQARRVLSNLEKFKSVIFDFDQVPMVGQSFCDEIFRIFKEKHPEINLSVINVEDSVKFMIERTGFSV